MPDGVMLHEKKKRFSEGVTGYHYLVLAVACFGWSFDTMDQWLYVLVKGHALRGLLPASVPDADVSKYTGYVQTALIFGWATGGLIFGMVGDRLGRTRTMIITIMMYAGFTGLSGLAQNWHQFLILRFLTGLGVGGEFAAGAALVAETFPDHSRATALGIVQATSALGNVTAALINMAFTQFMAPAEAWRWILGVGAFPVLLVVVIALFIHEPDRWKAARELSRQKKKDGIREVGSIIALFSEREVRRNTFVGLALGAVGIIGFWGISTWTPELVREMLLRANAEVDKTLVERYVSLAAMSQNIGAFFGALTFAWFANRIGRRGAFAVALVLCLVEIPATFYFATSITLALVFFFGMGFSLLFLLSGFTVYFPELFPTRLRATGTGFCYNVSRYAAAPFAALFGVLSASFGIQLAALMLSSVFLLGLVVLLFAPETKGKPLPE
ncbi:MAG: MFS transporter [Candidatus Hydrogenedens sp.]|nr:MFS transporter [Candidatus Hydrogenedentota bacterium]NLF56024.1 MFS transporter [Candidatus Hydrogenedens sp.]